MCTFSDGNHGLWAVGVAGSNLFLYFKLNYLFKKADDYVEKSNLIQPTLHNFSKISSHKARVPLEKEMLR
jgi:hypothetical protein